MDENKSLVVLVQEFAEMDRALIESGGELTPDLEAQMSITGENLKGKVDRYKLYMDHLDSRAEYFKAIEYQARDARKLFENHNNSLRAKLKMAMNALGVADLYGNDWRFKLSSAKPKMLINEDELDPKYKKEVTTLVPDKERIEMDLTLGITVPGATLESTQSLRGYVHAAGRAKPVKEPKPKTKIKTAMNPSDSEIATERQ